jgi:DNA (cytosine-5)-methyltransferase 1
VTPRLLDLFCGAGGAAMGYHRAGFDVVGVDIAPQPHYPFDFERGDALEVLRTGYTPEVMSVIAEDFDAIHASPPCQSETTMSNRHRGAGGLADRRADLLTPTLEALVSVGLPWVVENVVGASSKMREYTPILLHGGMFGLGVNRPRLFCSNTLLMSHQPAPRPLDPIGVYGKAPDGRRLFDRADGTTQYAAKDLAQAQKAMGMDWADWHGTKEAIPPAYSEYIGAQLMQYLKVPADALDEEGT